MLEERILVFGVRVLVGAVLFAAIALALRDVANLYADVTARLLGS